MLSAIIKGIDTLIEKQGQLTSFLIVPLALIVLYEVMMRYLFNAPTTWGFEATTFAYGMHFMLGLSFMENAQGHVRVDIIYQRLGLKGRAWVNLIGVIFFLIPGCLLVIITSWKFVLNAWLMMEGSPDPGGIPFRYLIKGTIPVGFALMLLQGIVLGIHSLLQVLGIETAEEDQL